MNDPYGERRPALKAEIVARVGAGETVKAICAGPDPGMPSAAAIERWAKADPEFGAALSAARLRAQTRRDAFDPARAQALLNRLSSGETIEAVLADRAMPSRRVYRRWLGDEAPFAEAVHRFRLAQAEARAAAHVGRRSDPAEPGRRGALAARAAGLRHRAADHRSRAVGAGTPRGDLYA